jgi:methyl-accepting chemotaxis protein
MLLFTSKRLQDKLLLQDKLIKKLREENAELKNENVVLRKKLKTYAYDKKILKNKNTILNNRLQESKELLEDTILDSINIQKDNNKLYTKNLTQTLLDVQGNILNSTSKAKADITKTQEIEMLFEVTLSKLHNIFAKIDDIVFKTKSTSIMLNELEEMVKKIGNLLKQINHIALESDLLGVDALVACVTTKDHIEFDKIANEVKKLSEKISLFSKDVMTQLVSIEETTQISNKNLNEIDDDLKLIDDNSKNIEKEIDTIYTLTKTSFGGISQINNGVFNSLLKLDQVITNVNQSINQIKDVS